MSENRRVKMTKRMIQEAFLDLLEHTYFEKITITHICEKADVNRSTFYAYYEDTRQLLADIENSVLEQIPLLPEFSATGSKNTFLDMLTDFFEFIQQNKRTFLLLQRTERRGVSAKLIDQVFDRYLKHQLIGDSLTERYTLLFCLSGAIEIATEWLTSGFPISSRQLAETVYALSQQAFSAAKHIPDSIQ